MTACGACDELKIIILRPTGIAVGINSFGVEYPDTVSEEEILAKSQPLCLLVFMSACLSTTRAHRLLCVSLSLSHVCS